MGERVDSETLGSWRNPTAFVCKLEQPTKPFFAVAADLLGTHSPSYLFVTGITILPQIPSALLMMLSFQPFSANVELVFNTKQCRLISVKFNSREVSNIDKDFSIEDVIRLNCLRSAVSNALKEKAQATLNEKATKKIPHLLQDVLKRRTIVNRTDNVNFLSPHSHASAKSHPTLVWVTMNPDHHAAHRITGQYYPMLHDDQDSLLPTPRLGVT